MNEFNLYKDIRNRTEGEIYIGVVGPVRCGKSTFIKRFMDLMVLPSIEDSNRLERTRDELPQSSAGKTIMTTEPKFIPKEAANIMLDNETSVKIRLIDCVGYMTNGAVGHIEDEKERMVKTPWFDYEIPFTKAASLGTKKVITEHSTIGIVVTSDGSFGDFNREDYLEAEDKTITELLSLKKPFVVLLNSSKPFSEATQQLAAQISEKYMITVIPVNCSQLKSEDIRNILEKCLLEFPVVRLNFFVPKWIQLLDNNHSIKKNIFQCIKEITLPISRMSQVIPSSFENDCSYINDIKISHRDYSCGSADLYVEVDQTYYYEILSELSGSNISDEYELIKSLKEMGTLKNDFIKLQDAYNKVQMTGYGVVMPNRNEITLDEPQIIKNGSKYGVKIKAKAPSIHMIKADILTEIAPIVGSEKQANELIQFIKENASSCPDGIWSTNIFGKTIDQIVNDGISSKIENLSAQTQEKMQDTLQKITNDSHGGVICIII